jgi:hypothetical protein
MVRGSTAKPNGTHWLRTHRIPLNNVGTNPAQTTARTGWRQPMSFPPLLESA